MTAANEGLPVQPDRIETVRLVLRRYEPTDALAIQAGLNDREVAWTMGRVPYPYGGEDAHAFLAKTHEQGEDSHAITLDGELIGGCTLKRRAPLTTESSMAQTTTIGYWIARKHWRQGYASEAVAAKLAEHFAASGETVTAVVFADNKASHRVLGHVGFRKVGTAHDANSLRESPSLVFVFECTATDFAGANWNLDLAETAKAS